MCFINYLYFFKIKPQINKNMATIKNKILLSLANSLTYLNIHGIVNQFPINAYYVQLNLVRFREDIFDAIKKDINNYPEIKLSQLLLLLTDNGIKCPPEIYNLVLDKLIEKRKDPTLENSFELNYIKDLSNYEFKELTEYKKYVLWSEINTDINYSIFRGFGFNFYTIDNVFYKEYNLSTGRFIVSAEIEKKPEYFMTGHNIEPGILKNYKYCGVLPKKPEIPIFISKQQSIKYAVDLILNNLKIPLQIKEYEIIMPEKDYSNYSLEKESELNQRIYNSLIKRFIIEENP